MDQTLITRIVEAALLAANQPLSIVQLHGLFPLDEPAPEGSVTRALHDLQADCEARGIELVELASGWRYQVKADVHPWVARLWTERQTKYTRATLETLALIAYRQPITRGEIEQVRGVAVNSNIIKALEEREWIRVVGHRDIPGRPELLGTTKGFLDYFGLKRLDELPPLSELKDFGELDPQFPFHDKHDDGKPADGEAMPIGDVAAAADQPPVGAASAATGDEPDGLEKGSEPFSDDAPAPASTDAEIPARPEPVEGRTRETDTDAVEGLIDPSARPSTSSARADAGGEEPSGEPNRPNEPALAADGDSTGARND